MAPYHLGYFPLASIWWLPITLVSSPRPPLDGSGSRLLAFNTDGRRRCFLSVQQEIVSDAQDALLDHDELGKRDRAVMMG